MKSVASNPEEEIPAASSPTAVDTQWDSLISLQQFSNSPTKPHKQQQQGQSGSATPQEDDYGLRMKNRDAERRWSLGMDVDGVRGSGNNVALYSGGKSPAALSAKRSVLGTPDSFRISKDDWGALSASSDPVVVTRSRRSTISDFASSLSQSQPLFNRDTNATITSLRSGGGMVNFVSEEALLDPVKVIFQSYELACCKTLPRRRECHQPIGPVLGLLLTHEQAASSSSSSSSSSGGGGGGGGSAVITLAHCCGGPVPSGSLCSFRLDSEMDKSMTVEPATPARPGEQNPRDDVQGVPMVLSARTWYP